MSRVQTIYSLRGVFNQLLEDAEMEKFMIPAYQRGYKWSSFGDNSQVEVLMKDLFAAFEISAPRYYLQFITLKEHGKEFEVIDGQQRLTTLTILFSVLLEFEDVAQGENFVAGKLNYQVRENFIKEYVYENIQSILNSEDWDSFLEKEKKSAVDINNQDVYFIYHATKAISAFIVNSIAPARRKPFFDYIAENVLLIVNPLESNVSSEKIFINVNKGVKLKDEDLVKGLLITRVPLENLATRNISETEINEIRTNLGRQWDELAKWASREDIRSFFKIIDSTSSLGWIIHLVYPEAKGSNQLNPLFTYIDTQYQHKKLTASQVFKSLREMMLRLNDLFTEPELSNLLGYILHTSKNNTIFKLWSSIALLTKRSEILAALKKQALQLLPINVTNNKLDELSYEDSKDKIFNLFLMVDVAKFLPINNSRNAAPYNFKRIFKEDWSIEHIFPQNPEEFDFTCIGTSDLTLIKQLIPQQASDLLIDIPDFQEAIIRVYEKIKGSETSCEITGEEVVYVKHLISRNAKDLHRLGNLALLDHSLNAGLSNHFFESKRKIIVQKVSAGRFVPFHTYDVFSKLILDGETSLHVWTKDDINNHERYLTNQVAEIANYLKETD
ncbi:MAG TPA: DUF262 domain-containing protein [Flavisolibacter sp.]|jgi:hypothetical protein|nr:DUF262 domain-containing protein [Flavisolibacter sp.]